jgi:hypothetical protein
MRGDVAKKAVDFVKGVVPKKSEHPVLQHVRLENGRIIGFDGLISFSSPIGIFVDATLNAKQFSAAMENCGEEFVVAMQVSGNLSFKSGKFKCEVQCSTDVYPSIPSGGQVVKLPFEIVPVLKTLLRFVSKLPDPVWARGILFKGQSAFASNSYIIAEQWLGIQVPRPFVVPREACQEIIRLGEEPEYLEVGDSHMTLVFEGDRRMTVPLLEEKWPEIGEKFAMHNWNQFFPIPAGFWDGVESIEGFVPNKGQIEIKDGWVSTGPILAPAHAEVEGLTGNCKTVLANLEKLKGVATATSPLNETPIRWVGDRIRGLLAASPL